MWFSVYYTISVYNTAHFPFSVEIYKEILVSGYLYEIISCMYVYITVVGSFSVGFVLFCFF